MAIRRGRFHPGQASHSTTMMSQRSYSMPPRSLAMHRSRAAYETGPRAEDYMLFDRVSDVSYLSNATLDESDDTIKRSRGRDAQLLRNATDAIVSSESYATPQASVASRRVARGRLQAPRAASAPPKPFYPQEAAIIASKMEPDPLKRRRPRSEYAATKYRELRKEAQENVYAGGPRSTGLHSSKPPLPKQSQRKIIRTEDGYSKPKNLLSWKYRLDAMVSPTDVVYAPSSYIRIREQVRDAQEKMDRHRQMMDRYLVDSDVVASAIKRRTVVDDSVVTKRRGE